MNKNIKGFSLIELMLVSGVSGLLLLAWVSSFSYHALVLDRTLTQLRKEQQFYQLALWLVYELERARDSGNYAWQWGEQCLTYGNGNSAGGVRVRHGQLQWRGSERSCSEGYWLSMTDTSVIQIAELNLYNDPSVNEQGMLRLSGQAGTKDVSWEHRFDGALYFEP